ncbi:MAG: hypothetical protein FWG55_09595 [Candidatus Bathyarchaeota archaeon]|nr:hypothetical protein [Candidatus Termiticorpusculum sp.]
MAKLAKPIKQLTLDSLPATSIKQDTNTKPAVQKQIHITKIEATTRIDELVLKVSFRLEPSWRTFSKVKADLFFEDTHISAVSIQVLQGPLGTNELEYSWVMDTKNIAKGTYHLRVEMYEAWSSDERSCQTIREITVNYVPKTRQERLIRIPIVKSVTGADMAVISNQEKRLYLDLEKAMKKEQLSRRNDF